MVNETNKPQECLENDQLNQRLVASNQALANMQAEHRQLLAEMEQLRKRAEDLQRMRDQQDREDEEKILHYTQNVPEAVETLTDKAETENLSKNNEKQTAENNDEDNSEEADYIKEKLTEIARLKAQFKRVQHMVNTTELIENHIGKTHATEKQLPKVTDNTKGNVSKSNLTTVSTEGATATDPEDIVMPAMPSMHDLNSATTADEKEQLILTMLNMFQDFSSNLKSQADNLRAERERIKELKESIIRSRKEQPK